MGAGRAVPRAPEVVAVRRHVTDVVAVRRHATDVVAVRRHVTVGGGRAARGERMAG
ncbi:hypothetical protein SBRY_20389 [Actinacidiphila bryophytorum]|uniref:Uncharacterized protein n=1 Tax=Actinacidiphila bryophytorum TaxID=1436133 RepID=A0A9W4E3X6_9ACTN|nr:hypothetical protein SBRY_20389 [Actinacidiphila bryophytorum]